MILGKHTLDETKDLLAVADYRFRETGKAFKELAVKPDDLVNKWDTLTKKWAKARDEITDTLLKRRITAGYLTPSSVIATEQEYQQILSFIQFKENEKGSLQDITRRIEVLSGKPIMYENQPSQNSGDVDSELFKKLDSTTKTMDAAAVAAREEAKKAVTSNTGLIIGGSVLGTLIAIGLSKKYL